MDIDRSILEAACEHLGVRLLVLFGSHVPGGLPPGAHSDVDVAVAFEPGTPQLPYSEIHEHLAPAFRGAVPDLVLLGQADPLFRLEIMDPAVLLYGRIDDFFEHRAFAYRDFVDSADLRKLERALSEKKMIRVSERLRAAT